MTILVTLLRQNRPFFYYYAAFLAHSCLISALQWLIDTRKCPTISPDARQAHLAAALRKNSFFELTCEVKSEYM